MMPSSSLRDRVLADAAAHPARTRAQGRRRAALVYAIAAMSALPLYLAWGGVSHVAERPVEGTVGIALGAGMLATLVPALAWRGTSPVDRSRPRLWAVIVGLPLATYVWSISWHLRYAEPIPRLVHRCIAIILVSGGPLLTASIYLRKRVVVRHPGTNGAALGALFLGVRRRSPRSPPSC